MLHSSLKQKSYFGGELLIGKRKTVRPVSTKYSMHTTMHSSQARGVYSFLLPKNTRVIRETIFMVANRFGIQVYDFSINSNHLHLLTRARTRHGYQAFLRVLSATIVMKLTGGRKGNELTKSFWDVRPWSRIVAWGKAFFTVKNYVIRNQLESLGRIAYQPREKSTLLSRKKKKSDAL